MSRAAERRRAAGLAIAALGWLSWPAFTVPAPRFDSRTGSGKAICWILMDMTSFQCAACLEPLLALCRALPARIQEEKVLGILVDEEAGGAAGPESRPPILLKKWRGLCKAHDIRFPAVVDEDSIFRDCLNGAILVLLVHEARSVLAAFPLPLKAGQMEEIIGILADRPE